MANFKDIIGQESIKKHLQTAIKTGNLSQDNSVLANNCANICQTAKEYIGI